MSSLFIKEPVTLDGYKPHFTREECLLGLKCRQVQIGGGLGDLDYDPNDPKYENRYSITIAGHEIHGDGEYYGERDLEIAVLIANQFLANKENALRYPDAWAFLVTHGPGLTNSKRYWLAVDHRKQVDEAKQELAELQRRIWRGEIVASLRASEVHAERNFSQEEKAVLLTEFSGGEWDIEEGRP